jgi:hypothetical protein
MQVVCKFKCNLTLGILEIMPPEWTNFILATNIPDSEGLNLGQIK